MIRRDPASRGAFSLLEVMIATAILAGSAMVLFSLMNLGTRLGNRSEARLSALVLAQSILDESIARLSSGESQENYSGELAGPPTRSYRVSVEPVPDRDDTDDWNDPEPPALAQGPETPSLASPRMEMLCVTVELFEGSDKQQANRDALVKLERWVRIFQTQSGASP